MANALHSAIAGMQSAVRSSCGESVTYHRGPASVEVTAVVGSTRFDLDDGSGVVMQGQVRDFLVKATDIVLDGEMVEPKRGDVIRQMFAEKVLVFEVAGPGGEPHFRPSDAYGETLRIHTRHIGSEPI